MWAEYVYIVRIVVSASPLLVRCFSARDLHANSSARGIIFAARGFISIVCRCTAARDVNATFEFGKSDPDELKEYLRQGF